MTILLIVGRLEMMYIKCSICSRNSKLGSYHCLLLLLYISLENQDHAHIFTSCVCYNGAENKAVTQLSITKAYVYLGLTMG